MKMHIDKTEEIGKSLRVLELKSEAENPNITPKRQIELAENPSFILKWPY